MLQDVLVVLATAVVAGAVNTMVGAGTTIMLPVLDLVVGLPPQVANGTNRLAVCVQALAAAGSFHRQGVMPRGRTLRPALIALVGGALGAWLNTLLAAEQFRSIMGWVLLASLAFLFVRPRALDRADTDPGARWRLALGYLAVLAMGTYGGFLGAGIGMLMVLVLPHLLGLGLISMVAVKVWMVCALSLTSGLLYLAQGWVDWRTWIPLVAGYSVGGVLGARLTVRIGERWLRWVVAVIGAFLALLLIVR